MRRGTEGGLRLCVSDIRGEERDRGRFEAMCGRYKGHWASRGRFEAMCE